MRPASWHFVSTDLGYGSHATPLPRLRAEPESPPLPAALVIRISAVLFIFIGLNALYVAAEFAAVAVRRSRVRSRAQAGDRLARRLLPFLEDPRRLDDYIAACQVGITLSSLMLGAYGQARLSDYLVPVFVGLGGLQGLAAESAAGATILLALTGTQVVVGELIPKSLALHDPTRVARITILPMEVSLRVLRPLTAVLNGSGWWILGRLGIRRGTERHLHSPEEIEYLVAESRKGGLLEPEEHRRLQHALAMDVRRVRQLMVPRTEMKALPLDLTVDEALEAIDGYPYTRYPVYRDTVDGVTGIVHARDLALRRFQGGGDAPLHSLLRPVLAVPQELTADRFLAKLREGRAVMAVVVDEFGGVSGIVTIQDLLTELLGEMADESWPDDEPPAERLPDGRLRFPGRLPLHEAEEWTGLRWGGTTADTINGVLAERLGRFPVVGDVIQVDGATIVVESVLGTVARTVLVTLPPEPEEDPDD